MIRLLYRKSSAFTTFTAILPSANSGGENGMVSEVEDQKEIMEKLSNRNDYPKEKYTTRGNLTKSNPTKGNLTKGNPITGSPTKGPF